MKVVILAGGFGTRLSEETDAIPKPLVEIGGRPILWHIMKRYTAYGFREFVICCGYKGHQIKRYFLNYIAESSALRVTTADGKATPLKGHAEDWVVDLIDTGLNTMTGGRLKRIAEYVGNSTFCMTYGDGVSDVDVSALVDFHRNHGRLATVTAVPSPGRFGILDIVGDAKVQAFLEKPHNEMGMINGGFFVLEPAALDLIEGDATVWEKEPLETLARQDQLAAYIHHGFWKPMDTLRDKRELENLWASGHAPWQNWL